MSKICKSCHGEVKPEDRYCIHCGKPLERETETDKKWNKYDWEKDEWEGDSQAENANQNGQAKVVTMKQYILMGILLAIPFVNLGVCVAIILNKKMNPNHRNLAKAWLVLNIIGLILGCILAFVLFHMLTIEPLVHQPVEHMVPQTQMVGELLTEI